MKTFEEWLKKNHPQHEGLGTFTMSIIGKPEKSNSTQFDDEKEKDNKEKGEKTMKNLEKKREIEKVGNQFVGIGLDKKEKSRKI